MYDCHTFEAPQWMIVILCIGFRFSVPIWYTLLSLLKCVHLMWSLLLTRHLHLSVTYTARLEGSNKQTNKLLKDMHHDGIGLCAHMLNTTLGSTMNTIGRVCVSIVWRRRESSLWHLITFASRLQFWHDIIRECSWILWTQPIAST